MIAGWLLHRKDVPMAQGEKAGVTPRQDVAAVAVATAPVSIPDPVVAAPPVPPMLGGKSEMQAYRLTVRAGIVSLDAVERLTGEFRQRRGPVTWMPGMWCVRLLDADMRVLAEDTAPAPDAMCVVLDPQNKDAVGAAQATQFSGAGEEAMLQVRLPPQPGSKWLKVYRLASMQRADWNTEPMGQVLASISLP